MGPDPTKLKIAIPRRLGPVTSPEQLRDVVARVQAMAGGRRLLFRGQGHLYPSIRSGRARPKAMPTKPEVEQSWISMAEQMLGTYDHKWQDTTLYEPHPMRMWRGWHYELESRHEGISGDVANSIKLTVSPHARKMLEATDDAVPCEWPSLQCSDILFCYAEIDHDKVIDHGPPYYGVWLHRDDELILESPMSADEDTLAVHSGHAYLLQRGGIHRKVIPGHCPCNDVASHDNRVKSMLRIPALVRSGELLMIPHPMLPRWYVVL